VTLSRSRLRGSALGARRGVQAQGESRSARGDRGRSMSSMRGVALGSSSGLRARRTSICILRRCAAACNCLAAAARWCCPLRLHSRSNSGAARPRRPQLHPVASPRLAVSALERTVLHRLPSWASPSPLMCRAPRAERCVAPPAAVESRGQESERGDGEKARHAKSRLRGLPLRMLLPRPRRRLAYILGGPRTPRTGRCCALHGGVPQALFLRPGGRWTWAAAACGRVPLRCGCGNSVRAQRGAGRAPQRLGVAGLVPTASCVWSRRRGEALLRALQLMRRPRQLHLPLSLAAATPLTCPARTIVSLRLARAAAAGLRLELPPQSAHVHVTKRARRATLDGRRRGRHGEQHRRRGGGPGRAAC
jgi:hypothetical protein